MDPFDQLFLLGGGPGPALYLQDTEPAATMVIGANGVEGGGDGGSSSGSDTVTAAQAPNPVLPGRRCFVTVGATAGFRSLLDEVSTAGFFQCLAENGYTTLDVQCGPDLAAFEARIAGLSDEEKHGISVRCFDYTGDLEAYIINCRGQQNVRPAGCVISHGGTGTVGEVLGVGAPLIVVANPTLMDNHQLELALSLEEQDLAVHGRIGTLAGAIDCIAERITRGTLDALPPYCPPPFPPSAADRVTLFDWMVLTCYPDELATQMHAADLGEAETDPANEQQHPMVNGHGPAVVVADQDDNGMLQLD